MGGFSVRRKIDQFGTVLPFSDLEEAGRILENFSRDFQQNGVVEIEAAAKRENPSVDCFEFSILAGLAGGSPDIELASIMEFAEFRQEPIAQFTCRIWKESA